MPAGATPLGPALCMVRDVPIGQDVNLGLAGLPFWVENRTQEEQSLTLRSGQPAQEGMTSWERGYEPIPDAAWLRIEPNQFTLPPRTRIMIAATIAFPNQPNLANRRFLATYTLSSGSNTGPVGAGLARCGRIQIETQVGNSPVPNAGAPLSFAPGTSLQPATVGAGVAHVVQLRNNHNSPMKWELRPFERVITVPDRQSRYIAAVPSHVAGWSVPSVAAGELAPGQEIAIHFVTQVPANAGAGIAEEIWFAGPAEELDMAGSTSAPRQPMCAFIRLHHQIGTVR
ncbi:MAG: hypothetical protein AAB263_22290 [Planctomycetota bacterium]